MEQIIFYKISFDLMINSPNDIVPLSYASAIKWLGEFIIRRHFRSEDRSTLNKLKVIALQHQFVYAYTFFIVLKIPRYIYIVYLGFQAMIVR